MSPYPFSFHLTCISPLPVAVVTLLYFSACSGLLKSGILKLTSPPVSESPYSFPPHPWRPLGDSNPRYRRERAMSWATRRWGRIVKRGPMYEIVCIWSIVMSRIMLVFLFFRWFRSFLRGTDLIGYVFLAILPKICSERGCKISKDYYKNYSQLTWILY